MWCSLALPRPNGPLMIQQLRNFSYEAELVRAYFSSVSFAITINNPKALIVVSAARGYSQRTVMRVARHDG